MKIKVTTERECCHPSEDLKTYSGSHPRGPGSPPKLRFCVHCGQLWHWTREPGDMDYGWERFPFQGA